jgi:hypothetical protein
MVKANPAYCDTGRPPPISHEVSDDGLHRLSVSGTNPAFVDLMFEDVMTSAYSLYVSTRSIPTFQVGDSLVRVTSRCPPLRRR